MKVETHIFEGANHLSYYPRLAEAGLSWVLPQNVAGRVPTAISQEAMDRVVGAYVMADGRKATIQRRGGVLIAQMTGMPGETEILAETERRFFVPGGYDVLMSFEGPERAPATALVINMGGAEMRALRAKP